MERKLKLFAVLFCSMLIGACNDNLEDLIPPAPEQESSSSISTHDMSDETLSQEELVEFKMTDEMRHLKKLYEEQQRNTKSLSSTARYSYYDEDYEQTYWSNMYAIRELPAKIKVRSVASGSRSDYKYFYCSGKKQEVVLNNGDHSINNRFFIKMLPASSGIPYLIYSKASQTPLSVGHYTRNPNEKILMSSNDNIYSYGSSWDLLRSDINANYYIECQDYLGQSPDYSYGVFRYVLEASKGNKIRYAEREPRNYRQMFEIIPDARFKIISVEYDLESAEISKSTFKKTVSAVNKEREQGTMDVYFNFYETESSYFGKNKWNVSLNFENKYEKFARPTVIKSNIITPTPSAKKDATLLNESYQNINRNISYIYRLNSRPQTTAKVTLTFVKYNVTMKYVAKAHYEEPNGNIRECILKGDWTGTIIEDPKDVTPKDYVEYTPLEDGDIPLAKVLVDDRY